MTKRYFEDFAVGERFVSPSLVIDAEAIVAFARQFDPQPFHLDPVQAEASVFKGLAASGWHTAALTMRLMLACGLDLAGGLIGRAVEQLEWPRPVRPGDRLHVEMTILDLVPSSRNPARGTARVAIETRCHDGEVVQRMVAIIMVPRRPAAS